MLRIHKKSLIFILLFLLISGCQAQQVATANVEESSTIVITRTADITVTPIATVEEPVATSTPEAPQIISTSLQSMSIEAYHSGEFVYPVTNPSWSHADNLIAFSDHDNIWTVNPKNWQETDKVCTTDPFSDSISNLVWSPDDLQIAFLAKAFCTESENCITKSVLLTCERASGNITTFQGLDEGVEAIFDWRENQLLLSVEDSIRLYDMRSEEWQAIHLPGVQLDFLVLWDFKVLTAYMGIIR